MRRSKLFRFPPSPRSCRGIDSAAYLYYFVGGSTTIVQKDASSIRNSWPSSSVSIEHEGLKTNNELC